MCLSTYGNFRAFEKEPRLHHHQARSSSSRAETRMFIWRMNELNETGIPDSALKTSPSSSSLSLNSRDARWSPDQKADVSERLRGDLQETKRMEIVSQSSAGFHELKINSLTFSFEYPGSVFHPLSLWEMSVL